MLYVILVFPKPANMNLPKVKGYSKSQMETPYFAYKIISSIYV